MPLHASNRLLQHSFIPCTGTGGPGYFLFPVHCKYLTFVLRPAPLVLKCRSPFSDTGFPYEAELILPIPAYSSPFHRVNQMLFFSKDIENRNLILAGKFHVNISVVIFSKPVTSHSSCKPFVKEKCEPAYILYDYENPQYRYRQRSRFCGHQVHNSFFENFNR